MAAQLDLGPEVCVPLRQFFTRWDGRGVPAGTGGEAIAPTVRLFHVADVVEVYHRADGVRAAVEVARARRGGTSTRRSWTRSARQPTRSSRRGRTGADCHQLIAADPGLQRRLTDAELDDRLVALADFTDLRSTYRAGHSRGVADLPPTRHMARACRPILLRRCGALVCCTTSGCTAFRPRSWTNLAR